MSALAEMFLSEIDTFDGSDEERLQAIGQVRADTWIAALTVIADIEGTAQARQSLEALAQADTLLVVLALGWLPAFDTSGPAIPLTRRARRLHRRLMCCLERRSYQDDNDPSQIVRAVEQAYREMLSRTLGSVNMSVLKRFLAIHYTFRQHILHAGLDLLGEDPRSYCGRSDLDLTEMKPPAPLGAQPPAPTERPPFLKPGAFRTVPGALPNGPGAPGL